MIKSLSHENYINKDILYEEKASAQAEALFRNGNLVQVLSIHHKSFSINNTISVIAIILFAMVCMN